MLLRKTLKVLLKYSGFSKFQISSAGQAEIELRIQTNILRYSLFGIAGYEDENRAFVRFNIYPHTMIAKNNGATKTGTSRSKQLALPGVNNCASRSKQLRFPE